MRVEGVVAGAQAVAAPPAGGGTPGNFGRAMLDAIDRVNDLQYRADAMSQRLAAGDLEHVHETMLAISEASLALQYTLAVRNKIIEAYQELMRMPL